jgi:N-acetylmuramoyl-L-alanine amidase
MNKTHKVRQGECIDSIALLYGFSPSTIWLHECNAELKSLRKDPNILYPMDEVFIPDLCTEKINGDTDKRHKFVRKGVPAKLKLRFLKPKEDQPPHQEEDASNGDEDPSTYEDSEPPATAQEMEPVSNTPYRLNIGSLTIEGETDSDGSVEAVIPPDATEGEITFDSGGPDERTLPLAFGQLDPVDTLVGARKRLRNLGYHCTIDEDEMTPELREVIAQFQTDNQMTVSGELDRATKDKLVETHGS